MFGKRFRFSRPESADIVIFGQDGSQFIKRAINPVYRVYTLDVPMRELFVAPIVLWNFFRFLPQLSLEQAATNPRGTTRGILSQLRCIYIESCLAAIAPKAVITFIDNSGIFHWLSKHCSKFPFLAIQNGTRLRYANWNIDGYCLQHYFCWGEHERLLFEDLGFKIDNYYPIGSLLGSLYFDKARSTESPKYDLLVVSSWRGNMGFPPDVLDTMRSMKIMDELLAQYIRSKRIKAAIILRTERNDNHWTMPGIGTEHDYYREIYGDAADIIEANFADRTVYPIMQQSRLVVSCLSSALIEAYGIGLKILYCNFTGINAYHCDFDPAIVTADSDFEQLSRRLDDLLALPSETYRRMHSGNMKKMMNFPPDWATYKAISHRIDTIVEGGK
jgi:hypothetical protein